MTLAIEIAKIQGGIADQINEIDLLAHRCADEGNYDDCQALQKFTSAIEESHAAIQELIKADALKRAAQEVVSPTSI